MSYLGSDSGELVGDRLRLWRKQVLGMTQEEFSEATGVHLSAIRKYEGHKTQPNVDSLQAIGRTGINLHWLVTGEGEMRRPDNHEPNSSKPTMLVELGQRMSAIEGLLAGLDSEKRLSVLDEIFSRVQEAKRVADLEELVRDLERKVG